MTGLTREASVEVWTGGDLEAGVRHEEAADLLKARPHVDPQLLQFLVLPILHLEARPCKLSQTCEVKSLTLKFVGFLIL